MSIQIVLQGNHVTDVIAEIQQLAAAIGGPVDNTVETGVAYNTNPVTREPEEVKTKVEADPIKEAPKEKVEEKVEEKTEEAPKKPSAKEQNEIVERLIADQVTNGTDFDMLTKSRQKKVIDALKEVEEETADVDSMFDDEPTRTIDDIRTLMGNLGKNEDGTAIQDNLIKMREILTGFIPKGSDVKVGNVPEDKIGDLYAALEEIKG